jgi:multiple sugar transport system permease protein
MKFHRGVAKGMIYGLLILGAFMMLLPFLWMLSTSFKSQPESLKMPPTWVPENWVFKNYGTVWNKIQFPRYIYVSLIVTLFTVSGSLLTSVLAAYAFSWFKFPLRDSLFVGILSLMMIPMPVYIVPLFVLIQRFGWMDTFTALIVPWTVNIFSIFLLRQHFRSIPKDLYDAAVIDGCGRLKFLFKVVLPLAKPALITVAIFGSIYSWNSFMWPLMVTNSDRMRPIQVGLAYFAQGESTNYPALMAASAIALIPLVILFFMAQRQIVESYARSGLKE